MKDYEVLRKELPGDSEVAEALLCAHEALKKSRGGEEVHGVKFGRAEEVSANGRSKAMIHSTGKTCHPHFSFLSSFFICFFTLPLFSQCP